MDEDILALVSRRGAPAREALGRAGPAGGFKLYKCNRCLWMAGFGILSNAACLRSLLAATPVIVSMS